MNKEILRKAKEEKGITLIALVITIIVLLILAGITLSMVLGPNGIINRAKQAKEETERAALNEQLMFNEVDNYLEELGKTELPEETEAQKSIKIIFNSGDDRTITLPSLGASITEGKYQVDWGDGTTGYANNQTIELASENIKEINIAAAGPDTHQYPEANKEYTVTITGTCTELLTYVEGQPPVGSIEQIVEIAQWGSTGLTKIDLSGCINLRKIASPTKNSFGNVTSFEGTFYECSSLTSIPSDLFANCPNVTSFAYTFYGCSSLTNIPSNLFANCPSVLSFEATFYGCSLLSSIPADLFTNNQKVKYDPDNEIYGFKQTFFGCTSLTGNSIRLWAEGREGITETQGGKQCYTDCTGLSDYDQIPENWKLSIT